MNTDTKKILVHAFNQILPAAGIISQQGNQWRLTRSITGLEPVMNRSFNSQAEVIDSIADVYVEQANQGRVVGLTTGGQAAQPATEQTRRAV